MTYLPAGLPAPVTEPDELDLARLGRHAARRAQGAALWRLQHVATGAGMALP